MTLTESISTTSILRVMEQIVLLPVHTLNFLNCDYTTVDIAIDSLSVPGNTSVCSVGNAYIAGEHEIISCVHCMYATYFVIVGYCA